MANGVNRICMMLPNMKGKKAHSKEAQVTITNCYIESENRDGARGRKRGIEIAD